MSTSRKRGIHLTAVLVWILGIVGFFSIVISSLLGAELSTLSRIFFNVGSVVLPLSAVGWIVAIMIRHEVERRFLDHFEIVFPDERQGKMRELIISAKRSLVIVGNSPLYEFRDSVGWLAQRLAGLRSIKMAYLAPDAYHAKARVAQSGGKVDIVPQLRANHEIVLELKCNPQIKNLEVVMYDLPPAEFFYIADDRNLLATWYPFGEAGERSPCIFVEDTGGDENARRILEHFKNSFEFLKREFGIAD